MKLTMIIGCLPFVLANARAQQEPTLLSAPPDGSAAPAPEVHAVFKPAEVLETTVTRKGGRDVIVQHLALDPDDPIKPVLPPPPVAPSPDNAAPADDDAPPSYILLLSATVHPGPRTFLSWTHHFPVGSAREFSGWSNIDFNHLTGITTFLGTDGAHHSYMMAIGTEQVASDAAPEFPVEDPTFIPDSVVPAEVLVPIDSLHKIYAKDGAKLAAAHAGRERARLAKEAELLANPPQPKDLIIRYRIAETPLPTPAEGGAQ